MKVSEKNIIEWLNKALALMNDGCFLEAILWLEKAEKESLDKPCLFDYLAFCFLKFGLYTSAKNYLEKSLKFGSKDSKIRKRLERLERNPLSQIREVSFYIPCYNGERYLADCIKSILNQSYPIKEIILVDDASCDSTVKIARQYPIKLIRHKKNLGLASARNTALKFSNAEFLASIDVDVCVHRFWLEYLMTCFRNEMIAGAGGKLIEAYTINVVDRWRKVNMPQSPDEKSQLCLRALRNLHGFGCVYRKKYLKLVGGYDERFKTNNEDVDLSFRLRKYGFKLVFMPKALAWHLRKDNTKSLLSTYWRWYCYMQGERLGRYSGFPRLIKKTKLEIFKSFVKTQTSVFYRRQHLFYLDLLSGIWNILEDIRHMYFYSGFSKDKISDTLLLTLAGFIYVLKRKGASEKLLEYVFEDLRGFLFTDSKAKNINFKKINNFFDQDAIVISQNRNKLLKFFPNAEFDFVFEILSFWYRRFKFNNMYWKMLEVSARRIKLEEKFATAKNIDFKVMLLNPPWQDRGLKGVRAGSRWPFRMNFNINNSSFSYRPFPFFLAYATALLKKHNFNAVMLDAIAEDLKEEDFLEMVRWHNPDVVLIEASTASIFNDLKWAERIKVLIGSVVVFSGTHVSAMGKSFLKKHSHIDYVIRGEYELAFLGLVKRLRLRKSLRGLKGVGYRKKNNDVILQGRTRTIMQLDKLPFPERLTLPIYNYFDQGALLMSPMAQVMSSRGCPFGCIFCLWPQVLYGNRIYRMRDTRQIVDEIEMLTKEYGFTRFYFDDDTFNISRKKVLEICQEIIRKKIKIEWSIMARADLLDYKLLKILKDSGLVAVKLGVESASQRILNLNKKQLRLSKVKQTIKYCRILGIKVHLSFMLGLLGETKKTLKKTIKFALALQPDNVQFSLATPFPGTAFYRILEKKRSILSYDWSLYDSTRFVVINSPELSSEELENSFKKAEKIWLNHLINKEKKELFGIPSSRSLYFTESKLDENKKNRLNNITLANFKRMSLKPKRIAFVDALYKWPPRSGAHYDITALASHLHNLGFEVQLFALEPFIYFSGVSKTTSFYYFPIHQISYSPKNFSYDYICEKLNQVVCDFDPDCVFLGDGWSIKIHIAKKLSTFPQFLRFYAYENICLIKNGIWLKDGKACPFNFLQHPKRCQECVREFSSKNKASRYELKEFFLCDGFSKNFHNSCIDVIRQAKGIIVYNRKIAELLLQYNKNTYIIPSGVNPNRYYSQVDSDKDTFNILFSGRVEDEVKGFYILKNACGKIYERRKDIRLIVATNDDMEEAFIKTVDWHSQDLIPDLYAQADVCVIPSLWHEPFGIVALEAMAAGKPVIASRVGGLKDIVLDGVTGFLVDPENVEQIVEKIELLIQNPTLCSLMGQAGRKRVKEHYSWTNIIRDFYLPLLL